MNECLVCGKRCKEYNEYCSDCISVKFKPKRQKSPKDVYRKNQIKKLENKYTK